MMGLGNPLVVQLVELGEHIVHIQMMSRLGQIEYWIQSKQQQLLLAFPIYDLKYPLRLLYWQESQRYLNLVQSLVLCNP